jgi:peptide/nickel transport system ATP-binding protein
MASNQPTEAITREEAILQVKNLQTAFFTDKEVIRACDGVSFDIKRGETVGIVGESGSGKSVTARSIMGLIKSPGRILDGSIQFKDEELTTKSEKEYRQIRGGDIAMVFQDPLTSLNPVYSVGNQIKESLRLHQGLTGAEATKEAINLLEAVGIPDAGRRVREYPHEFSGGMRQRAVIAMALACNPDLLIADEPTTNLDVTIERQILNLVRQLQKYLGTSVLWITHDMAVIAEMCDRVAVMYAGNIVELSDVRTIFKNPAHPYTVKLLNAIPSSESTAKELDEIPGAVPQLINPPSGCRFHPRCERAIPICSEEKPEELNIEKGHMVACHLYS